MPSLLTRCSRFESWSGCSNEMTAELIGLLIYGVCGVFGMHACL